MRSSWYWFFFVLLSLSSCKFFTHKKLIVNNPNGYFREEYSVYKDSIKDGEYKKFFPDGKLMESCTYKMDSLDGERKIYTKDGKVEILENYNNGKLEGKYNVFYPNGKIKLEQTFKNGSMEGMSLLYYETGQLKEKVMMKKNEENGPFEQYYESGKIHWKGNYLEGDFEQDTLYEYDKEGILLKKMYCTYGVCQTVWTKEKGKINVKPLNIDPELIKKLKM